MYNYQDTDNYFYDWWKHNTGGNPEGEPWGADAEPVYNTYMVEYESTESAQSDRLRSNTIEAVTLSLDKEERVAVFYGGCGELLAVVYNILFVKAVPPRTNV